MCVLLLFPLSLTEIRFEEAKRLAIEYKKKMEEQNHFLINKTSSRKNKHKNDSLSKQRFSEYESGVEGVKWWKSRQGWTCKFVKNGNAALKIFRVSQYGSVLFRNEKINDQ